MQHLEVSGALRPIYGSLGAEGLLNANKTICRINRKDQTGKVGHLNCRNARESVNILRQKLCCETKNFFSRCKMHSEAGDHSLLDFLWNKASSTTVEKLTPYFWSIQAPYVIKLPEQVLCWGTHYSKQQDCSVCLCVCARVSTHTAWNTNIAIKNTGQLWHFALLWISGRVTNCHLSGEENGTLYVYTVT
jgi:hypothetical protein